MARTLLRGSAVAPYISALKVEVDGELQALTEQAASELARFDAEVGQIAAPFASILLRTESASSSEIENLSSGARQIALAELGAHTAQSVPPHHERVPALMEDLTAFANRLDLPVLVQIAVAHAQFETILPFPDGNGRVGRALIQAMLRGGRLTRNVAVPVSAGLLRDIGSYFDALSAYRSGDLAPIIQSIAEASFAAVQNGRMLVSDLEAVSSEWLDLVKARRDSSAYRLMDLLLRQPVVDSSTAADELGVAAVNAQVAINRLVDAGVLTQIFTGKRNRIWLAKDVI